MSDSQTTEATSSKTIRNFLYVDEGYVNSLASQIFGGVADQVVRSRGTERERRSDQKGRLGSGKSTGRKDTEDLRLSERRVMYDRAYSKLESALGNTIFSPGDLHRDTVHKHLESGHFIRVSGETVLENYRMLGEIFENWTSIGDALVAAEVLDKFGAADNSDLQQAREELQEMIKATNDSVEKKQLQSKLDSLPSNLDSYIAKVKNDMGMHDHSEWIEKHLNLFNDLFQRDSLSFSLRRALDEQVSFHAPLNEMHLRFEEDRIRSLHNGNEIGEWTMVGRVTRVPNYFEDSNEKEFESAGESAHMRDHFRSMISGVQEVYRQIYESENLAEVVLLPLALYQETSVEMAKTHSTLGEK